MAVYLSLKVSQGTPNTTARTTTVTATVTVHYSGGSYNGYSPPGTLMIDDQSFDFTCSFNYAGIGQGAASQGTGSEIACTQTATVSYGSSSTKTIRVYASFASGTGSGTVTASQNLSLTPISSSGGSSGGGEGWEDDDSGGIPVVSGNAPIAGAVLLTGKNNNPEYRLDVNAIISNSNIIPTAYVLKFTTPTFTGVSQSLEVGLGDASMGVYDGDYPVCFALCDSDANIGDYVGATSIVNDSNQIVSGSLYIEEWHNMPISIKTSGLESEKDYYLVFWIPSDIGFYAEARAEVAQAHYINVIYGTVPITDGAYHIDSGSEHVSYHGYIDNGTSWDQVVIHIDNGTDWGQYS